MYSLICKPIVVPPHNTLQVKTCRVAIIKSAEIIDEIPPINVSVPTTEAPALCDDLLDVEVHELVDEVGDHDLED